MGERMINLLHLILMVVEPFHFYLVSLDEVKCLVDDNSTNSGYIDIYILHLALLIIISICFYNQLRLVRLLLSELFPVVFDIALLLFSTVVVTSTRTEAAATSHVILMLVYAFIYVLRSIRLLFCKFPCSIIWPTQVFFALLLYILGAHLFGSLYYVFAIKEKLDSCGLVGYKYNKHGYYRDVSRHGFHRRQSSLVQRSYFCFQWGLQNLIYLGKNLQPTNNTSQDLLELLIVVSGVYFWVLLLECLKTYYYLLWNPDRVHGGGMVVPGPDSPEEDDKAL